MDLVGVFIIEASHSCTQADPNKFRYMDYFLPDAPPREALTTRVVPK